MRTSKASSQPGNAARALLLGAGALLIAFAGLYGPVSLEILGLPVPVGSSFEIRSARWIALVGGCASLVLSEWVRRVPGVRTRLGHPLAANLLVFAVAFAVPLLLLELALKPFASASKPLTTIFLRDEALGWKLRPGAEDVWGNVRVRINAKGLRGPELDYVKPEEVARILYLGDSVTFGFMIEDWQRTFPYQVQALLDRRWGYTIETINAGVGGYSTWQEYLYLADEGVRYEPDLVVVSFVLNDVTEKFDLIRFGGANEGWQLRNSALTALDRLSNRSSIAYFARDLGRRLRFGSDVAKGAVRHELLNVRAIAEEPDRADVRRAWKLTLENLQKIFALCEERRIRVLLVIFPYRFQFEDSPRLAAPQRELTRYAAARGVPTLDLLPLLSERMSDRELSPQMIFLGENHLSPIGGRLVADAIASFIHARGMLDR